MINPIRAAFNRGDYTNSVIMANKVMNTTTKQSSVNDVLILKIRALYELGKYDEASTEIRSYLIDSSFPQSFKLQIRIELAEICRKQGEIGIARDQLQMVENELEREEPENIAIILSRYLLVKGNLDIFEGKLDQAEDELKKAMELFISLEDQISISTCLNNLGIIWYDRGNLDKAHSFYEEALKIRRQFQNRMLVAQTLNNIGMIHDDRGNLHEALKFYKESLAIYQDLGIKIHIASAFNNIGEVLRIKGELDRALEYYTMAKELFVEIGNEHYIGITLHNIGRVQFDKKQFLKAEKNLCDAREVREHVGHDIFIAETYFQLTRLYLAMGSKEGTEKIRAKFKQLVESSEIKRVELLFNLSESIILKSIPSSKSRVQAQIILEDISKAEIIDHQLSALALIHLTDILIDELRLYKQQKILDQITEITNQLYSIAQSQFNLKLIIQVLILRSRFQLILGEIDTAERLIEQADIMATENNLHLLAEQVGNEYNNLKQAVNDYRDVVNTSDITDRLEDMEINEYIEHIRRQLSK